MEEAVGTELTNKLTENLKENLSDNKVNVIDTEVRNAGLAYDDTNYPLGEA